MADVELSIAGRPYRVACREGEEDMLRAAAALVDGKSREALAGLGAMTESRQLLFAALMLADQLVERRTTDGPPSTDPALAGRVAALAGRLEQLAETLEKSA